MCFFGDIFPTLLFISIHSCSIIRCIAQRQSDSSHTAAFCLLQVFWEKNSFYGLLSSQLPCSRCSCRRCLLPPRRKTQRDQLICTVINRKETFERSARQGVNAGMLLLNAPTWQGSFIWLMDYILRVWTLL